MIGNEYKLGTTIMAQTVEVIKVQTTTNTTEKIIGIPIQYGNDTSRTIRFREEGSASL